MLLSQLTNKICSNQLSMPDDSDCDYSFWLLVAEWILICSQFRGVRLHCLSVPKRVSAAQWVVVQLCYIKKLITLWTMSTALEDFLIPFWSFKVLFWPKILVAREFWRKKKKILIFFLKTYRQPILIISFPRFKVN